ncbi:MAG: hypothetical protein KF780_13615 [Sphingomonas sp.]|nr:hypothetical protein [Sphingomonas sp.]
MMDVLYWVLGIFGVLVVIAIVIGIDAAQSTNARISEGMRRLTELGSVDSYASGFDGSCLGIDWDKRQIFAGITPDIQNYDFNLLQRAEIDIDGVTVTTTESTTKTRRGAQIAGAAVGGIAFGPVGLLVGGFTGGNKMAASSLDKRFVNSITIVMHFRDRAHPIQSVTFFKWEMSGKGVAHNAPILKDVVQKANRYHALLSQIIEERQEPKEESFEQQDVSIELERLWSLRQAGALTEAEFNDRKRKLLR